MNNIGSQLIIQKNYQKLKQFLIGIIILLILKTNGMIILMENLKSVMKGIGSITKALLVILLVLITCTCNGVRLTSGNQTFARPIEYSTYSGRLAKPIQDVTECVILRIDDQGSLSWQVVRSSTLPLYPAMPAMESCPSPVLMLRKCLQTKSCQSQLTTRSSSSQSKTVWIDQKRKLRSESQHQSLPDGVLRAPKNRRIYKAWTPPSIGRTPVITPTMERNSNSLRMMNQGNGRGQTTYSTTGELRKQP